MMGLTPAQERVHRFVREYIEQHGYSPSYEEIRSRLGFKSLNSVFKHIRQLEQRGVLQSPEKNRKRALELIPLHTGAVSIPFLGNVAAGTPIEAIEVPESFLVNGDNFALRVKGDSMIDEGIRDGDILIISRQNRAENGQTVVALVSGETTVKKFHQNGNEVELRPANSRMSPLFLPADTVEIVGTVIGLLRHYRHRAGRNA